MSSWHHQSDPYQTIPIGYKSKKQYLITGFCSPAGLAVNKLMVEISWDGGKHSTTMKYLDVLQDYLKEKYPGLIHPSA